MEAVISKTPSGETIQALEDVPSVTMPSSSICRAPRGRLEPLPGHAVGQKEIVLISRRFQRISGSVTTETGFRDRFTFGIGRVVIAMADGVDSGSDR